MIYFINIIDVTIGGGTPKWYFIHPETPEPLRKRLYKYRDLMSGFVYSIITAFGNEILGAKLRELKLSEIQVIFSTLKHRDYLYYVIFVTDIKDNPSAVNKIFLKFYKKYYKDFDEILSGEIISTDISEKLRTAMAQFLVPYSRQNPALGARDTRHLFTSYVLSMIITGILALITWVVNRSTQPHLMDANPLLFAALVFLMIFVIPGIPIGIFTQYRKFAVVVAYTVSLTMVLGATIMWQDLLISYAELVVPPGVEMRILLLVGAILAGLMLGTILMMISYAIAWYFETRKLTSIRPLATVTMPSLEEEPTEESPGNGEVPSVEDISVE